MSKQDNIVRTQTEKYIEDICEKTRMKDVPNFFTKDYTEDISKLETEIPTGSDKIEDDIDFDNISTSPVILHTFLQRSCTGWDCKCIDQGLKPCSTYKICCKCYREFDECKCQS